MSPVSRRYKVKYDEKRRDCNCCRWLSIRMLLFTNRY